MFFKHLSIKKIKKSNPEKVILKRQLESDLETLALRHDPNHVRLCPISFDPIQELPVEERALFIDGEYYNKTALLTWLSQQARAPITNLPMTEYEARYGTQIETNLPKNHRLCSSLKFKRTILLSASSTALSVLLILGQYPLANKIAQTTLSIAIFALFLLFACSFCFCPLRQQQRDTYNEANVETRFAPFILSGSALMRITTTAPLSFSHPGP
jgi:hypothetical protein